MSFIYWTFPTCNQSLLISVVLSSLTIALLCFRAHALTPSTLRWLAHLSLLNSLEAVLDQTNMTSKCAFYLVHTSFHLLVDEVVLLICIVYQITWSNISNPLGLFNFSKLDDYSSDSKQNIVCYPCSDLGVCDIPVKPILAPSRPKSSL